MSAREIVYDDFAAVDMRVGRVIEVEDFPEARKPAWKLTIDFGQEIGVKRSSAQVTNYPREALEGRRVVAVVNFPPRQIGPVRSEVLVLGALRRRGARDPARARRGRAARRAHPLNDRRQPWPSSSIAVPTCGPSSPGTRAGRSRRRSTTQGIAYEVVKGPLRRGKRDDARGPQRPARRTP